MESISVFDMLKIGVGPSSSHTLGPWRAAERWLARLNSKNNLENVEEVEVHLYGSLSLTGKGHATDYAVMLGLLGADPELVPIESIDPMISSIKNDHVLLLNGKYSIVFDPDKHIIFNKKFLPFHANGLKFQAKLKSGRKISKTYYSIGGGFVIGEDRKNAKRKVDMFKKFPFPVQKGTELLEFCKNEDLKISDLVLQNERSLREDKVIDHELDRIWSTMLECMYTGCHTEGTLPGGLKVKRRAFEMHNKLKSDLPYSTPQEWLQSI
ncbi:MAG TPA: L-serine ammonia-lyase, partial [Maribacter sp.]|nr:L-serine ammonia-lyase [Maribacter sp.]